MIMPHLVRGIVTKNADPERLGRVQVKFPWLGGEAGQQSVDWLPVLRAVASPQSGCWYLPHPGDEVLIGFEWGRKESAFVLGSFYTERAPPGPLHEETGTADVQDQVWAQTTPKGQAIVLSDFENGERILIRDSSGRKIDLHTSKNQLRIEDAEGNSLVLDADSGSVEVKDQNGNEFLMNANGIVVKDNDAKQISLTAEMIHIKNESGVAVRLSKDAITIHASQKITLSGADSIELGSGAAEALLKGKTFVELFNAHCHTVGPATSSPPLVPLVADAVLSQTVKTS